MILCKTTKRLGFDSLSLKRQTDAHACASVALARGKDRLEYRRLLRKRARLHDRCLLIRQTS